MRTLLRFFLPALLSVCVTQTALGHTSGASFLSVRSLNENAFAVSIDLDVSDLQQSLQLDEDVNGELTWREIDLAALGIESLALTRTLFDTDRGTCVVGSRSPLAIAEHGAGPFVRLALTLSCPSAALRIDHSGWFAYDPSHRALLEHIDINGAHVSTLLSSSSPTWRMHEPTRERLQRFLSEGAVHLVTGYDHLAFLAVLLLALVRKRDLAVASPLPEMLRGAAFVITAFTVAHSITLGLAATGHLMLPSQPVEVIIAASVLLAALLNLWRGASAHGWKLAFAFGLVHGLGFAGALAEMTREQIDLLALAAFNLGIEAAQLAVAAVAVPFLWWLFRADRAERIGVPAASLIMAGLAAYWMMSRIGGPT